MTSTRPSLDSTASTFAADQHGVVTRQQLLAAGYSPRSIGRRTVSGRLRILHRGVYAVGSILPPTAAEMAAVLACGPDALVSHGSAAHLWGILVGVRRPTEVRVTVTRGQRRPRPGIVVHRIATVAADERTSLDGIPVTTPARTLLDLVGEVAFRPLEQAVAEAIARRFTTREELVDMAARHRGRRGAGTLMAIVDGPRDPDRTRSPLEERFRALVHRAGAPAPLVNTRVAGHEVDFYWPQARLVVEVDGFAYHSSPRAAARDNRRNADLLEAGLRVWRVTWEDVVDRPEGTLLRLGKLLASGG